MQNTWNRSQRSIWQFNKAIVDATYDLIKKFLTENNIDSVLKKDGININNTELSYDEISDILFSDFDDFWNINIFKNELLNSNSKYIVAKLDNKIVGYAGIWKAVDDLHITNIVTAKKLRKQNIGSILLSSLIEMAKLEKGITSITLEVNSTNIPALRLYEKFGFKKVGLRKKYYNNTDDAIIMTLKTRDIPQSMRNTLD